MKIISSLLLSLLFFVNAGAQEANAPLVPGEIVIAGQILNFENPDDLPLVFKAGGVINDVKVEMPLDADGNFHARIAMLYPQDVVVGIKGYSFSPRLYAGIGDSLYITADMDDFLPDGSQEYQISGKGISVDMSQQIIDWEDYAWEHSTRNRFKLNVKDYWLEKTIQDARQQMLDEIEMEYAVIDSFAIADTSSAAFIAWLKDDVTYSVLGTYMKSMKKAWPGYRSLQMPERTKLIGQLISFDDFPLDDAALDCWSYAKYLRFRYEYVEAIWQDKDVIKLLTEKDLNASRLKMVDNIAGLASPSLTRDAMCYVILKDAIKLGADKQQMTAKGSQVIKSTALQNELAKWDKK